MKVPLVDLVSQHRAIAQEVHDGLERLFSSGAFILGEEVARFEQAFADFCGLSSCVAVGNGTDALELALRAMRIGPGDEVICPVNSFVASALAILRAGASPVFCDVDAQTHLIDISDIERRISPSTRAIMPVHLYGQMAQMEVLVDLAKSAGLKIVEDAAQSQGAVRNGQGPGMFGNAAGTSFYPAKNIGAYGDAGAVLTQSVEIADEVRALRNYGSKRKYVHTRIGFNSRMDSMQAVILNAKLARLEQWNNARKEAADRYFGLLADASNIDLPMVLGGNEPVWHLFVVQVPYRDQTLDKLLQEGIEAGVHYPLPIHLQPAFSFMNHKEGDFPVAEKSARRILSLPLFPEITEQQQQHVADVLRLAVT